MHLPGNGEVNAVHDVGAREDDNDAFASSDVVRSSEFMAALHLQTMDSSKLLINKGLVVGEREERRARSKAST